MRVFTVLYLFISVILLSVQGIGVFSLFNYGFAMFLLIASQNLYAYAFFGLGTLYTGEPLILFAYALIGAICFFPKINDDNKLVTTLGVIYIFVAGGVGLYFYSSTTLWILCFALFLMFLTRNIISYTLFGLVVLLLGEPPLIFAYLIGGLIVLTCNAVSASFELALQRINNVRSKNPKNNVIDKNELNNNSTIKVENVEVKSTSLKNLIEQLKSEADLIKDKSVKSSIYEIIILSNKILDNLDSQNEHKVNKMINYYIPELISIINDYITIEKIEVVSEENLLFKVNVLRILEKSKEAFANLLQSILNKDIDKTNIDIKVLEKVLEDENLI